jgi:hypothetical protein
MNTTWHTETGRLACRWPELLRRVPDNPGMQAHNNWCLLRPVFWTSVASVGWAGGDGSNPTPPTAVSGANYLGL